MVSCDKCKKEFEIKPQVEQLQDNVERIYFVCPHCSEQYTAYYLDDGIKSKQQRMKLLQVNYNNACKNRNRLQAEKLYKQMEKLQKEIKADMSALRMSIEKEG